MAKQRIPEEEPEFTAKLKSGRDYRASIVQRIFNPSKEEEERHRKEREAMNPPTKGSK